MNNTKPNVIIIMTDQQRANLRKSRGYELDTMPFLDSWSQEGVDFASAYAANPTCMPSRVSMMTGRYCESHHVRTNHNVQDVTYTEDMLDVFKEAGYTTAICGKNHSHLEYSDFDFVAEYNHLGYSGEVNDTEAKRKFADYMCTLGFMDSDVPSPGGVEVQFPYRIVSSAFEFMDGLKQEEPFFMWMSMPEPHNPFQVPEPYFDMFPPVDLPSVHGTKENLKDKGDKFTWLRNVWEDVMGEAEIEARILRSRSNYHGMLRLIDDQLKRFVEGLKERKLADDTIVIYLSDHGDFCGEYDLIRKGPDLPDILCRVPFVWKGPGIEAQGINTEQKVSIVDILPTLCDILGVEIPFGCQGKSILPILENKAIPDKEFDIAYAESGFGGLYWHEDDKVSLLGEGAVHDYKAKTFDCLNTWTQCGQVRAIWKGDYHLQYDMEGSGYLYDLANDPYELTNLWDKEECTKMRSEMVEALLAESLKNADPLPAPHNRYRTKVHPKGYWYQDYQAEDPGVRR